MQVPRTEVDWEAAEHSEEFQELVHRRRAFVIPATLFFLAWYLGFILLAGYAPDFMGESIYEGFTVGYALALTQFFMVWGLSWLYLRKADKEFDPLAERARLRAEEAISERAIPATGRFAPGATQAPAPGTEEVRTR
jgi:uncharacterized membrane protein (DUF485 family)